MGCGFNDIYVLAPERTTASARRFLEDLLPNRKPARAEYQFPEHAEQPNVIFDDPFEAIHYACAHLDQAQTIYFSNTASGDPAHALVFFTSDGGMVLGISVRALQEEPARQSIEVADWLDRLRWATGAKIGYALYESPPACETVHEFKECLAVAWPPKLVDGCLVYSGPDEPLGVVWIDWRE